MVQRPAGLGVLEFAVLSSLRAAQLVRGCVPLVDAGTHKTTTTALMEVATLKVQRAAAPEPSLDEPVVLVPVVGVI